MLESKTFALDWDDTFTADPDLWTEFIKLAKSRGHTVVIVTARPESSMDNPRAFAKRMGIEAIATDGKPKIRACDDAGLLVNIWIDDLPGLLFSNVEY